MVTFNEFMYTRGRLHHDEHHHDNHFLLPTRDYNDILGAYVQGSLNPEVQLSLLDDQEAAMYVRVTEFLLRKLRDHKAGWEASCGCWVLLNYVYKSTAP